MSPHGYVRYTRGCRCETCRAAKAEYVRERRQRQYRTVQLARGATGGRLVIDGIKHGLSGYQNFACRCTDCRAAKAESDRGRQRRKPSVPAIVGPSSPGAD